MGQRSQIYVRYQEEDKNYLVARYFQWNYGERMISRCRHTLEWIKMYLPYSWHFTREQEKLIRIIDTNFDMQDVVLSQNIIKEYFDDNWWKDNGYSFKDYVFLHQDNNDGQLYINIKGKDISYAFIDPYRNDIEIMNAEQYMDWNSEEWEESQYISKNQKRRCKNNFKKINKIARLMTKEELDDFINCKYEVEKNYKN